MSSFQIIRRALCSKAMKDIFKGNDCYDSTLRKIDLLKWENGKCSALLKIEKEHTNLLGGLHGGCSATIVDVISSMALLSHKQGEGVASVSVNINLTYMKGAKLGDEIEIEANTLRVGKTMAFLTCDIKNKANGHLLVQGTHTKFLIRPS